MASLVDLKATTNDLIGAKRLKSEKYSRFDFVQVRAVVHNLKKCYTGFIRKSAREHYFN